MKWDEQMEEFKNVHIKNIEGTKCNKLCNMLTKLHTKNRGARGRRFSSGT